MSAELHVVREDAAEYRGAEAAPTLEIAKPALPLQINLFAGAVEPPRCASRDYLMP